MSPARTAVALSACLVAISAVGGADGRSFDYSEIVVPGATFANAQGINAAGDVVGIYRDATGKVRGFLSSRGVVSSIEYPGAAVTEARGIGPHGVIVGTYRMAGEPSVNAHGFRLAVDGTFTKVDYPGHTNTIAQRILPNGTILGCRHDHETMETMRGVVIPADGPPSETDTFASMHNGASPDGSRVVGLFMDMMTGRSESYVIDKGEFTAFAVPGSTLTSAWDVNARGEIVGVYRDAANRIHGFLRDGDHYTTLDFPGSAITRAFGINARGDVVGAFVDGTGRTGAFIARRTRR